MSSVRYRYGHRPGKRRRTKVLIILAIAFVVFATIIAFVWYDLHRHQSKPSEGTSLTVIQSVDDNPEKLSIDEDTFTMQLPGDWKQIGSKKTSVEHSITWQATKKNQDNRYLTVYIDVYPKDLAINNLLPVRVVGNSLNPGDPSDNCASFTQGGTFDTNKAERAKVTPAKWQQVDFLCDLPQVIDHKVGIGMPGSLNTVIVTGPIKGTHKYFMIFTDHNIQSDYSILTDALRSFRAK